MTPLVQLETDDERARRQLEAVHVRIDWALRRRIRELKAEIERSWEDFANGRRSD